MPTIEKEPNRLLVLPEIILTQFPILCQSIDIILLGQATPRRSCCHDLSALYTQWSRLHGCGINDFCELAMHAMAPL